MLGPGPGLGPGLFLVLVCQSCGQGWRKSKTKQTTPDQTRPHHTTLDSTTPHHTTPHHTTPHYTTPDRIGSDRNGMDRIGSEWMYMLSNRPTDRPCDLSIDGLICRYDTQLSVAMLEESRPHLV